MKKLDLTKRLIVFKNLKFTKGIRRGVILDLSRNSFELIPNSLIEFINENDGKILETILLTYSDENRPIVESYIRYLIDNEYAFLTELESWYFPKVSNQWKSYSKITNCVIDINKKNDLSEAKLVIDQLEKCMCRFLEIRINFNCNELFIQQLMSKFFYSPVRSIHLVIPHIFSQKEYEEFYNKYNRISSIACYGEETTQEVMFNIDAPIYYLNTTNILHSCGYIDSGSFAVNMTSYTEGLSFNNCLNRKLYINLNNGKVKNCPSSSKIYGNIFEEDILDIIDKKEFKSLWKIRKTDINICKVCEFRNMCSDCRVFIENPDDIYSKPLKCGYNPYSGEWAEWSKDTEKYKTYEKICATI